MVFYANWTLHWNIFLVRKTESLIYNASCYYFGTLFHICAKLKTLRDLIVQMTFVMGLGLAVVVGLGLLFGSGIFTKDKSVRNFIIVAIPVIPSFWQNETLHIQYFSIADVVIYHGSQLKSCHAPLSLSQLPSRLMSWRLFLMVWTSEHLILPILHTPW